MQITLKTYRHKHTHQIQQMNKNQLYFFLDRLQLFPSPVPFREDATWIKELRKIVLNRELNVLTTAVLITKRTTLD